MSNAKGRTLKLFLVDGVPNGLLTAEIMNWTGHVITGPRSRLGELIQRPESRRTGVYFLVGPDSGPGIGTQVYIGETDDVAQRLTAHNRPEDKGGKDFWEKVCVVTSKDANLTKGHVKYLESRLIKAATEAGRSRLLNGTDPGYENLPEADRADMEFFIEQIQTLLPVLGFDFMRVTPAASKVPIPHPFEADTEARTPTKPKILTAQESPIFAGDVKKYHIKARGQEINGEFIVFKGSMARRTWEGAECGYTPLFRELQQKGFLKPTADDKHLEFSRDYAFSSPSAAATVVTGRSANGRIHWTDERTGQTYAGWQESLVNSALGSMTVGDKLLAELDAMPDIEKN